MNTQMELISPQAVIEIKIDGCEYNINYDQTRPRLLPKWYIQNMRTYDCSKRFYSFPAGAANALFGGTVIWEK